MTKPPVDHWQGGGWTRKRQIPGMEGDTTYSPTRGGSSWSKQVEQIQRKKTKDSTQSLTLVAPRLWAGGYVDRSKSKNTENWQSCASGSGVVIRTLARHRAGGDPAGLKKWLEPPHTQ